MAIKDMPREELLLPGNAACPGCPASVALRVILKALGENTVLTIPACCTAVIQSLYPKTSFKIPVLNMAFETAAVSASGIKAGLRMQGKDDVNVVAWAGDGGTYDIGLQALSGALERGTDFIYICYNNEMYSNTGVQRSGATPYGASTTTSWSGKTEHRKDLMGIVRAHNIPYAATACVAYPEDLYNKVKKAMSMRGPKFIEILAPCPPGWHFDMSKTIEVGRNAVQAGAWALYEVENGKTTFNGPSKAILEKKVPLKPIEDWIRDQGRFKQLFKPKRDEARIAELQAQMERDWDKYRRIVAGECAEL
ncbi:MAG: 2-ketoisovalerate ferredoxin oxidoreductase [Thermoplasmata archaeon HGW-Thermoplasmata-1]|nr:MAG: 2-ketoisovalerate ferredoxin oxidoreductase [Thermoplasmata archaeon HGW-Thermoplasmata-1]